MRGSSGQTAGGVDEGKDKERNSARLRDAVWNVKWPDTRYPNIFREKTRVHFLGDRSQGLYHGRTSTWCYEVSRGSYVLLYWEKTVSPTLGLLRRWEPHATLEWLAGSLIGLLKSRGLHLTRKAFPLASTI